jgi:hypothetical protein
MRAELNKRTPPRESLNGLAGSVQSARAGTSIGAVPSMLQARRQEQIFDAGTLVAAAGGAVDGK